MYRYGIFLTPDGITDTDSLVRLPGHTAGPKERPKPPEAVWVRPHCQVNKLVPYECYAPTHPAPDVRPPLTPPTWARHGKRKHCTKHAQG